MRSPSLTISITASTGVRSAPLTASRAVNLRRIGCPLRPKDPLGRGRGQKRDRGPGAGVRAGSLENGRTEINTGSQEFGLRFGFERGRQMCAKLAVAQRPPVRCGQTGQRHCIIQPHHGSRCKLIRHYPRAPGQISAESGPNATSTPLLGRANSERVVAAKASPSPRPSHSHTSRPFGVTISAASLSAPGTKKTCSLPSGRGRARCPSARAAVRRRPPTPTPGLSSS